MLFGVALVAWQGHRREGRALAWLDAGLAALVGGVIGARLVHVAVHWAYFSQHTGEIAAIWRGGLDWHGAVLGGLLALIGTARLRRVEWRNLTDTLAFVLPAGAALAFAGCLPTGCAAGREVASLVDYPQPLVAELPDVYGLIAPRFASQLYGVVLSLALLGLVWLLQRRVDVRGFHLWPVLALLSLGIFLIGFTLGSDVPMVGTLRLDQLLDLITTLAAAIMGAVVVWQHTRRSGTLPVQAPSSTPQGVSDSH